MLKIFHSVVMYYSVLIAMVTAAYLFGLCVVVVVRRRRVVVALFRKGEPLPLETCC